MGYWSIRLFRIFGIELEVHLTFLILWGVFAFLGWGMGGWIGVAWFSAILVLIFTCVVLHELGHSLTARHYGISVSRILLLPFGGMAQFERIPRNPRQEIVISLAGPAVNLLIVVALLPLIRWSVIDFRNLRLDPMGMVHGLFVVNVAMGLFNLLPIFPMDGGRILRAFLATRIPYLKATGSAVLIAKVLAIGGIFAALFIPMPLLVFLFAFIYLGGDMEYRMLKRREKMNGLFVRDLTRNHYLSIPADSPMADAASLFEAFRPGEVLVMDGDVPVGYLTTRIMRNAVKNGRLHEPAADHCVRKFSVLQAGWPLDPFAEMITQSSQRLYPVYSFGDLVGVVDTKNLESLIGWHRLREETDHQRQRSRPDTGDQSPA